MALLKLSFGNSKIQKLAQYLGLHKTAVASFDLPAGYTCPMANECQAFANRITGKITDGKNMRFRCYAASSECAFTAVRKARWYNYDLLRSAHNMAEQIVFSFPLGLKVLRIHSSGDFYSPEYFDAWVRVADMRPDISFFGYTKVLPYLKVDKPENFGLVYSHGGKMDAQLTNEPACYVVPDANEAKKRGLPVVCDDNPADDYDHIRKGLSFALIIHGTQPKGVVSTKKAIRQKA